jgi:hypothetical protein
MRLVTRWGMAVGVSAAGFVLSWWVCQEQAGPNEGAVLQIAGAVLALLLAVMGWWAVSEPLGGGGPGAGGRLMQKARAGRDVNMAGRGQTIINERHPKE